MRPSEMLSETHRLILLGETAKARQVAERAWAIAPNSADSLAAMALVADAEFRHDDMRRFYQAAVAADPRNASHRVALAYAMVVAGEFDAAREELLRAIALDPTHAWAYEVLAGITKAQADDGLIDALERLKRRPNVDADSLIRYGYALGKLCDDIGDYDSAFHNYKDANDRQSAEYDRCRCEQDVDDIKGVWSDEFLKARAGAGFSDGRPIFIVGMPRSGSTLIERRLAARGAEPLGERPEIVGIDLAIQKSHPRRARYPHWCPDLPTRAYEGFGRLYVEKQTARLPQGAHFIDKHPANFNHAGFIRLLLPDAHIIESRRSPLDTCLSCYFANLTATMTYSSRLANLGHYYRAYAGLMEHWRDVGIRIRSVDYEDLVESPESNAVALCEAVGLAGSPASGMRAGHIRTQSAYQARQPVYKSSVGRWRNYEKHLGPLIDALGDLAR